MPQERALWRRVRLGAVCREITVGFVGTMANEYVEVGVPFLRSQDVLPFRIDTSKLKQISAEFHGRIRKSRLRPGDVVVVRTGYPGTASVIPAKLADANCADLVIVRPSVELDPYFVACLFNSHAGKAAVSGRLVGAAQQHFNVGAAKSMEIALPPIDEQRQIASILSAYDDLIEVNRRRVANLEEMARRLFDEWFVRLRFPGHESVPVRDTPDGPLPEGWKWSCLAHACAGRDGIQTGPFGSQLHESDYAAAGVPVVMPKNLLDLRVSTSDIARIPEKLADALGRHRMRTGDVAYGRRGDIGRRAYISQREDGWFCGTGCLRLRPDWSRADSRYFFAALGMTVTYDAIKARAQGATMPNLSAGVMAEVPLLLPPLPLQELYGSKAEPIAQMASALLEANINLVAARDLLLPRLVSGKLSITAAPAPDRLLEAAD